MCCGEFAGVGVGAACASCDGVPPVSGGKVPGARLVVWPVDLGASGSETESGGRGGGALPGVFRWEEANRARNTIHHRVTNLRRDGLHKRTTRPTATIGTVVVDDVNMAGMLRHTAARPVDR